MRITGDRGADQIGGCVYEYESNKSRFWDWDWDMVIVRPLVKIKTKYGEISSETAAQRIYIFPYKTLLTNEDTPSF